MVHDISPALRKALQWWLAEATSEKPHEDVKTFGLCSSISWNCPDMQGTGELSALLDAEFGELNAAYPFGMNRYSSDSFEGTQHLNPDRLAWVRRQLGEQA